MLTNAIIDAVVTEGGFDTTSEAVSRATVLGWVQEWYDEALRDAGWRKVVYDDLGPTVVAQSVYGPLADHVIDVRGIRVDGSLPYTRVSTEELWLLTSGAAHLEDGPGAFAPSFSEAGAQSVSIFPTPTQAGKVIEAIVTTIDPTQLTDAAAAPPALPPDLHRKILVHGAVALGMSLIAGREDLATPHETRATTGIAALKKRATSRIGSGPSRVRVVG